MITCREDDEDAMVMLSEYRKLERENAALREAIVQCEDALRHALMMSPLDPFQRGKIITAALDKARAAIDAARKGPSHD
jgi:hypothetical protein